MPVPYEEVEAESVVEVPLSPEEKKAITTRGIEVNVKPEVAKLVGDYVTEKIKITEYHRRMRKLGWTPKWADILPGKYRRLNLSMYKPEKKFYRISKVREYYAKKKYKTRETPKPFFEVRVLVYTQDPDQYTEADLDSELDRVEALFPSIGVAKRQEKITTEVIGIEKEKVDEDEVTAILDEYRYYAVQYGAKGKPKREYPHSWIEALL